MGNRNGESSALVWVTGHLYRGFMQGQDPF